MIMVRRPEVWDFLEAFPPCYVRILANGGAERKGCARRVLSDAEIAISSGIPIDRVREIKMLDSYDAMSVAEMLAYFRACNFDPTCGTDRQRLQRYEIVCKLRNTQPWSHLRRSPRFREEILPVIRHLQANGRQSAA